MAEETQKTVISIQKPTPKWATYILRGTIVIVPIITTILVSDPGISVDFKARLGPYATGLVSLVWGLSRVIGVEIKGVDDKN